MIVEDDKRPLVPNLETVTIVKSVECTKTVNIDIILVNLEISNKHFSGQKLTKQATIKWFKNFNKSKKYPQVKLPSHTANLYSLTTFLLQLKSCRVQLDVRHKSLLYSLTTRVILIILKTKNHNALINLT